MAKLATIFRTSTIAIAVGAALLVATLAWLFQDNLAKFLIKPNEPFQVQAPPVAPSYGGRGAWAIWPDAGATAGPDIFYVHSTTYDSRDRWNGPVADPKSDDILRRIVIPNEAGPFLQVGRVFGPRYRQATLFAEFTHKFDGLAAHELAFEDVRAAFEHFQSVRNKSRPFILVGYGQGALHVMGLLQTEIAIDSELQNALAVAYLLDISVPEELRDARGQKINACSSVRDTGCTVAYIASPPSLKREQRRYRSRSLIWSADQKLLSVPRRLLICINPLSWRHDEVSAPRSAHLGAASATGLKPGEQPPPIKGAISAQCEAGLLKITEPQQRFLRSSSWFGGQWRPRAFNLFYFDLAADARRRADAHARLVKQSAG